METIAVLVWVIFFGLVLLGMNQEKTRFQELKSASDDKIDEVVLDWKISAMNKKMLVLFVVAVVLLPLLLSIGESFDGTQNSGIIFFSLMIVMSVFAAIIAKLKASTKKDIGEVLKKDERSPVLYLRAFEIDETRESNPIRFFFPGITQVSSIEDTVKLGFNFIGPILAVGYDNNDFNPIPRLHTDDWENQVLEFMQKSSVIVLRPYFSKGLMWELDSIIKSGCLSKVVFFASYGSKDAAIHKKKLRFVC